SSKILMKLIRCLAKEILMKKIRFLRYQKTGVHINPQPGGARKNSRRLLCYSCPAMKIVNRRTASAIKTPHGSELRPLMDRTTSTITQCSRAEETLPPGAAVRMHHHRELEEIYYILEGAGTMIVGDESREVSSGDAIFVPRRHRHSLANTGATDLKLLVVCG